MNKNLLIKKTKMLLVLTIFILSFMNTNLFARETMTIERLNTIWQITNPNEKLIYLREASPQVVESGALLGLFTKILQDLVFARKNLSYDEIEKLKTIISKTLYHQKVQQATDTQIVKAKELLAMLSQQVQTPITFTEEMRNLRLVIIDPERRKRIQESPETLLNTLTAYVVQRAGKSPEELRDLEGLLKTVRASKVFTMQDHKDQLDKLIEIVLLPPSLYEEIYKVYLEFKSGKVNLSAVEIIIEKYQKATKEEQEKCEELLTLLLKSIIYNPKVPIQDQERASRWLKTVVLKEEAVVKEKEPETYSEKVTFCINQAFNPQTFEDPKEKAAFLAKLSELIKQKIQATPQDLEKLISVLKYLDLLSKHSEFLDKMEQLQISDILRQIEKEMSVSEKLNIIFSFLGKLPTDPTIKDTILKIAQEIVTNLINTMKKDKNVPDETTTMKNLITVYLLEQPAFTVNKPQIEKWLANLKDTEEEVTKPKKEQEEKPSAVTPIGREPRMLTRPSRDIRPSGSRPGMIPTGPLRGQGYPSRTGVPTRTR